MHLDRFGPDGLDLLISFWIAGPENGSGNVKSDVNISILAILSEREIVIPAPQREVHYKAAMPS